MKLYVGGRPTFFTFFNVFSDFKKHDFLRFFEFLHTSSRTLTQDPRRKLCRVINYDIQLIVIPNKKTEQEEQQQRQEISSEPLSIFGLR